MKISIRGETINFHNAWKNICTERINGGWVKWIIFWMEWERWDGKEWEGKKWIKQYVMTPEPVNNLRMHLLLDVWTFLFWFFFFWLNESEREFMRMWGLWLESNFCDEFGRLNFFSVLHAAMMGLIVGEFGLWKKIYSNLLELSSL